MKSQEEADGFFFEICHIFISIKIYHDLKNIAAQKKKIGTNTSFDSWKSGMNEIPGWRYLKKEKSTDDFGLSVLLTHF